MSTSQAAQGSEAQRSGDARRPAFTRAYGEAVFDGVSILTAPGVVMTPVSTTEALVDWTVAWIGSRSVRMADVGTGSGAVAVAVALREPGARVWATDDNEAAFALAKANVIRHGLQGQVGVLLGNLIEPVPGKLDLVVANLPYHAEERSRYQPESSCRDQPEHAIYAPGDGLGYYRELLVACRSRLEVGGALAIQLYGCVLAAGRDQLDQLSHEMEIRAAEGWEARVGAASGKEGTNEAPGGPCRRVEASVGVAETAVTMPMHLRGSRIEPRIHVQT